MKMLRHLLRLSLTFKVMGLLLFSLLFAPPALAQPPIGSWVQLGLSNQLVNTLVDDPSNPDVLYAGTASEGIFKSTDHGTTWNAINNGLDILNVASIAVDPSSPKTIYATGERSAYKSSDGGANWMNITNGIDFPGVFAEATSILVDPNNTQIVYVGILIRSPLSQGGLWKSTDEGVSWTLVLAEDIYTLAIDPTTSDVVYAGTGASSMVNKSVDGGVTWTSANPSQLGACDGVGVVRSIAIDPHNTNVVYARPAPAPCATAGVYKSMDGGVNWSPLSGSPAGGEIITDPIRTTTVYVGSTQVYESTDSGANWKSISNGLPDIPIYVLTIPTRNPEVMYAGTTSGVYVYGFQVPNQPPTADANGPYTVEEGGTVTLNGSGSDPDNDPLTYAWDLDNDGIFEAPGKNPTFSAAEKDGPNSQLVTLKVCDDKNACVISPPTNAQISNVAPKVEPITASANPIQVNTSTTTGASFTDPAETLDAPYTVEWNWGDGNIETENDAAPGSLSKDHAYTATGEYKITLTVTDKDGGVGTQTFQYLSVYDPTPQGLFSAAQRYTSPAGAYLQDSTAIGNVTFGLSYKYQGDVPVGNRQFTMDFQAANFEFNATTVSSLVIADGTGTLRGAGTITDRTGIYDFLVVGNDATDAIRIQITDQSGTVIYDTQPGAPDTANPTTQVTVGNVIAH
jgi:photosystem II stability/assembly factor-like uncharacterized protein